jgi:hypothetical protein
MPRPARPEHGPPAPAVPSSSTADAVDIFLELFALVAACYVAFVVRGSVRRYRRRRELRRAWREPLAPPRPRSVTPAGMG